MSNQSEKPESHYVTTIRSKTSPAIAANIFRRRASEGSTFLDYEISRAWKSENREGYSSLFSWSHREAIKEVVDGACDWIEGNPQAADGLPEQSENGAEQRSAATRSD